MTAMTLGDLRAIEEANIVEPWLAFKHGVTAMRRSGGGSIVNTSWVAGLKGAVNGSAYGASKAGMTMFTKAVAQEGKLRGIRVNTVHPGLI
jgi:NAD(P)-dependent dehydrogenase (short-subunit alcohol dehydrogenase family)